MAAYAYETCARLRRSDSSRRDAVGFALSVPAHPTKWGEVFLWCKPCFVGHLTRSGDPIAEVNIRHSPRPREGSLFHDDVIAEASICEFGFVEAIYKGNAVAEPVAENCRNER